MKKILIGIVGLSFLLAAVSAFARPGGMGMGRTADMSPEQQQFFDATKDLRKEMHAKRFELRELYRTNAEQTKIDALQSEIDALRSKIQDRARDMNITSGPGACAGRGSDCYTGRGFGCSENRPCSNQTAGCGSRNGCNW